MKVVELIELLAKEYYLNKEVEFMNNLHDKEPINGIVYETRDKLILG